MRTCAPVLVVVLLACAAATAAEEMPVFPNFTFNELDSGAPTTVESLRGRPVLISFWASWCGPCRLELPELKKLQDELSGKGLVLITVNVDHSSQAAHRFVDAIGLEIPVYRMDQRDLMMLGVRSIPTTILLNQEGRPVQIYEGYSPSLPEVLRKLILEMLSDSNSPESQTG